MDRDRHAESNERRTAMALAPHGHRSHRPAPARAWPDEEKEEGRLEMVAVAALRLAALILVGYLGTIV
jgi:hypothetical protein